MPPKPKQVNVSTSSPFPGMEAAKVEYRTVEDKQE
jgi:hypothetical protein